MFACGDDETPKKNYIFSGSVKATRADEEPIPLSSAKLKVTVFKEDGPFTSEAGESFEVMTDANGDYNVEKRFGANAYKSYTIIVDDQYYHSCTGITSPFELSDNKALDPENENDLLVCRTGNVKIIADKVSSGAGNTFALWHSATKGTTILIDAGKTLMKDEGVIYPFYDGVSDVCSPFKSLRTML
jgi:hypothetical protein